MLLLLCGFLPTLTCCVSHNGVIRNDDMVTIQIFHPFARQVLFHASLTGFAPEPAVRSAMGYWRVSVDGTRPFQYFFTVDGSTSLPDCLMKERDDFGGENCIYSPEL